MPFRTPFGCATTIISSARSGFPLTNCHPNPRSLVCGWISSDRYGVCGLSKVKIYNREGVTVFSTQALQIGENKSDNPGFIGAMTGGVVSDIVYRDKFNAFDRVIEKRDLLSSYLPIRQSPDDAIVGVFELYTDITTLLSEVQSTEYKLIILVTTLMLGLYAFLLIYIKRADNIICLHEKMEQKRQQERIQYLAEHDQLTGLPNRTRFIHLCERAIEQADTSNRSLTLFHIDIDHFKMINDNLGHEAGDEILLALVDRIQSSIGGMGPFFPESAGTNLF